MIAPFIPYFIAANLASNASWPNGPEYVFNTTYDMFLQKGPGEDVNTTIIVEVHCQPKGSDSLNCLATKNTQIVTVINRPFQIDDYETVHTEAKFDANGVVSLKVSESLDPIKEVAVKRFASLFNVGVDLSNPAVTSVHGTTEKSVLGECANTVIKVKTHDAYGDAKHLDGQIYDLYPISLNQNGRRMNVVIHKIRDPNKCSAKELYYAFMPEPDRSTVDLKSTVSKISISDSGSFESSTDTRSKFSISRRGKVRDAFIYESIHAVLLNVKEATERLPSIRNPKIIPIEMLPEAAEAHYP